MHRPARGSHRHRTGTPSDAARRHGEPTAEGHLGHRHLPLTEGPAESRSTDLRFMTQTRAWRNLADAPALGAGVLWTWGFESPGAHQMPVSRIVTDVRFGRCAEQEAPTCP